MTGDRRSLQGTRRWVVKIGSALITNDGVGLRFETLDDWVCQIMQLRRYGVEVVLVSSGAVAEGIVRLDMDQRPRALHELQAAAAVGQMGLIRAYEKCFQKFAVHTAQMLLTHDDISNRKRYLNARSTLRTLVRLGVVPIVNENDSVATDEIRFGDNDTLAGLVSNLLEADLLVILTDCEGLLEVDPGIDPGAALVRTARAGDPALELFAGSGRRLGRGGMLTKLRAAATAAKSGAHTVIAGGAADDVLLRIHAGDDIGTFLVSDQPPLAARKQWLAGHAVVNGQLTLDDGAVAVLRGGGKSLLAVGVTAVGGDFARGEIVACVDGSGHEVARGLVNYGAAEARRIIGRPSGEIESVLGYIDEPELIHCDNLIVF